MAEPVRLGEIAFVNALPLALPIRTLAETPLKIYRKPPTSLNRAMQLGELDVSPVSSAFYLRNLDQFVLLEDLSISAESPVESVLLFLPEGWSQIHPEQPLWVPDTSETSVALMQYVVHRQTGYKCVENLRIYPMGQGLPLLSAGHPLLAIGDEALTLKQQIPADNTLVLDLARAWQDLHGLPFVFAVWVAQKPWAQEKPELLTMLNRLIVGQKQQFFTNSAHQQRLIDQAQAQCPQLDRALLTHYFMVALSYNLDAAHQSALARFYDILQWLDHDTLPIPPDGHCSQLPVQLLHR